jgi:hypothetical protein
MTLKNALQVTILILLSNVGLRAQSLPSRPLTEGLFGKSGRDRIVSMTENWQGRLAAIGMTSRGANGGEDIYLLLLDEQLKLLQERYIGRNADDGAYHITRAADGRYLVAGYSTMPLGRSRIRERYYGGRDGWLLLLDEKGQTVQEFLFGTPADDEFTNAFPMPDGGFLVVGNSGKRGWILRISREGQVIWDQKLQYHGLISQIKDAVLTSDNQLFITGYVQEIAYRQMWLAAFSTDGEKIWDKTVPASEANEGWGIVEMEDQTLGVTGFVNHKNLRENGFFSKIDRNGNQLAYQSLGGREDDRFFALRSLNNGRVILIGRSKSFERGSRRNRIWTVLLDKKGVVDEEKFYGSKTTDEGYAVLQRADGSLVAAGLSSQNILKSSQAWLADLTPTRKPPEMDMPLDIEWNDVFYANQSFLQPGERGFLLLKIRNPNSKGVTNLRTVILPESAAAPQLNVIILPPIASNRSKNVYIPLSIQEWASEGVFRYQMQLFIGDKPVSAPAHFDLRIGERKAPAIRITTALAPNELSLGTSQTLRFLIQNVGSAKASALNLSASGTPELKLPTTLALGDLAPGEGKVYELSLQLPNGYLADSAWLRVRVADTTFQHSAAVELRLPVRTETTVVKVDTVGRRDFITAVWLNPNPDQYDQREIVWHEGEIVIQVKVVSNKPLDKQHFCIEINGQPCQSGAKLDEVSLKGARSSRTFLQKIRLSEGVTTLRAIVQNESGRTETEPLRVVYAPRKPNLHVISIGVPTVDLKYTAKDARDFARAIQRTSSANQAFQAVFIDTLFEEATTTKTEILKTLRRLQYRFDDRQIAPNDLIVIFISSHGLSTAPGEFRIASSDYDGPFLNETSLDFEREIIDYLRPINCRKLFLIDACHSGAGGQDVFSLQASGTNIAELATAQKDVNLLVSCRANEYSYEDDAWQNGAFTKAIVQVLEGVGDLKNANPKVLDVNELYQKIKTRVPQLVQSKRPKVQTSQTPLLILSNPQQPMVLFQSFEKNR